MISNKKIIANPISRSSVIPVITSLLFFYAKNIVGSLLWVTVIYSTHLRNNLGINMASLGFKIVMRSTAWA